MINTVWHASPVLFNRPCLDQRIDNGHHPNSGLGLFTGTDLLPYLRGFGGNLYEIDLRHGLCRMRMSIDKLRKLGDGEGRDRRWFQRLGRRLGRMFDVIELVEWDGRVGQMILLTDRAITGCTLLEGQCSSK